MKSICLVGFVLILHSCYPQRRQNVALNENPKFKEQFLKCINNIEAYTMHKKNDDSVYVSLALFKESLASISRFEKVDYSKITNYDFRYVNYEAFVKDKERWLNWYEVNKNKNLQW